MCSCSSGYDLRTYPSEVEVTEGVTLRMLNTQVAEQVNAKLDMIRTQVCVFAFGACGRHFLLP